MKKTFLIFICWIGLFGQAGFAEADRTKPPQSDPFTEMKIPEIYRVTLENGLKLIVIPFSKTPRVVMKYIVPSLGLANEPEDKAGLAGLVAETVIKGTPSRDAMQIARETKILGGNLTAKAGEDGFSINLDVLRRNLPAGIKLFADAAQNADFKKEEVGRAKEQLAGQIVAAKSSEEDLAKNLFNRVVYAGTPYGRVPTEASMEKLSAQDARQYFAKAGPADATLLMAGNIDFETAKELAVKNFGSFKPRRIEAASSDKQASAQKSGGISIHMVVRPASKQSMIRMGHLGISGNHPDRCAIMVMNHVLGGDTIEGRLGKYIREKKNWSYGVGSKFQMLRNAGAFVIIGKVQNGKKDPNNPDGRDVEDATAPSIERILFEIKTLQNTREPADLRDLAAEVEMAKNALSGMAFLSKLETTQGFADQIESLELAGLDEKALADFRKNIQAVTLEDVLRVSKQYIDPSNMTIIVVGDPVVKDPEGKTTLQKLREIAPVTLYDLDGNVLRSVPAT